MGWAIRKVAQRYQLPPWLLGDPTELELYREAEIIEIEREIDELNQPGRPGVYVPGRF